MLFRNSTRSVAIAVAGALAATAQAQTTTTTTPAPAVVAPAAPADAKPAEPYTLTANVGIYSQYIFRGLTQTDAKPAFQGGFDYAHESGFYLGTWGSNISWLEDSGACSGCSLEWDMYGGWKHAFNDDWGMDVGVLFLLTTRAVTTTGFTLSQHDRALHRRQLEVGIAEVLGQPGQYVRRP